MQEALEHLHRVDPVLSKWITKACSASLSSDLSHFDTFQYLAHVILFQQLSGKAAATIERRFVELFPDSPYPTPKDVLSAEEDLLRSVGISRQKQSYLKDLARHAELGLPTHEELMCLDDEVVIERLTAVKGVGRWTVQMLLMFRLGRLDVLPVDDLGVRNGMMKVYQLEKPPTIKQMIEIAEPWRPYRSVGSAYMWRAIDTGEFPA